MFAQVFPLFQETFKDGQQWFSWATLPVLYPEGVATIEKLYEVAGGEAAAVGTTVDPSVVAANPTMMTVISALALVTNLAAICWIICISRKRHINPYKEDVFVEQKYYKDAMARAVVD
jgi:cyanate permease